MEDGSLSLKLDPLSESLSGVSHAQSRLDTRLEVNQIQC